MWRYVSDSIPHRGDFVARELAGKGLRTTRFIVEPAALFPVLCQNSALLK